MVDDSAVLVADQVAVSIDGFSLLSPTSLSLEPGACVALRGANGAGKTTLLRVLAGRQRATAGSVTLAGAPLDERRADQRAALAALIEPPTLYPDLTLRDQLALISAAWGEGDPEQALSRFGIEELHERFPHELSSGQRQLVSLAVTFARPCSVLLLDEPEQRLDPDRRKLVAAAILEARDRGVAVAFATHDQTLAERVAQAELAIGG
ncbi:ABC transporter ATP-binding protein [Leucobacter viscericola]|uniref:ABC transporter ATP-binding protein n=1 Tax=Leucobacter viscericola TaxID=2714935 RepID=A0A6G7XII0_9MICO|nr:ABC transporter ATP-binding protein [Leucobacter viscericola]QIK64375.1 ABC transporter ATP-binding protein [Leucobacter viscericola]